LFDLLIMGLTVLGLMLLRSDLIFFLRSSLHLFADLCLVKLSFDLIWQILDQQDFEWLQVLCGAILSDLSFLNLSLLGLLLLD